MSHRSSEADVSLGTSWSINLPFVQAPVTSPDLSSPSLFINRELSQLEFIRRVLAQADDAGIPLLERLRFICISSAILDEFFEIRVAGLKHQVEFKVLPAEPTAGLPGELLRHIAAVTGALISQQYQALNSLFPLLAEQGIRFSNDSQWTPAQQTWIKRYFNRELLPIMSPMALDPAHPFPMLLNKSLTFIVTLEGKDAFGRSGGMAVVQAPRALPRVVTLPETCATAPNDLVLLSSIIHAYVAELFPGMQVTGCYSFRVTRDSDLLVDPEEAEDLLRAVEGELSARRYGTAVRLEVAHDCPEAIVSFLATQHGLHVDEVYYCDGPVNLMRLSTVPDLVERDDLKYPPFTPGLPRELRADTDMFAAIRSGDILLHHPFQSFTPVIEFLRQAAEDPEVLAIRQTLYRTGADSAVVRALIKAANTGKEVLVVIELRARFDEEANIELANLLQKAGAKVVYGVVGLKTHAKMALVVRREGRSLRRYVHLGTGNYHTRTARMYTDYGLFTCDTDMGEDVHKLFSQLTSLGRHGRLKKLLQAPFTLHSTMLAFIERETEIARSGQGEGRILLKMNALIEPEVIRALYRASLAGVTIRLLIRGVCGLRPGVPGISENIEVRSVVGRFLEHTRVFYFENNGAPRLYLSSADWMGRNFFNRIEACFPIENAALTQRILGDLVDLYWADSAQSWRLNNDGSYSRVPDNARHVIAQSVLLAQLANH